MCFRVGAGKLPVCVFPMECERAHNMKWKLSTYSYDYAGILIFKQLLLFKSMQQRRVKERTVFS